MGSVLLLTSLAPEFSIYEYNKFIGMETYYPALVSSQAKSE